MARLILTNNREKFDKSVKRNINAGFDDYSKQENETYLLSAHKKRIKKIDNYLELPNGDFCCVVGTCIYDEDIGIAALKKMYDNFDGDIENTRKIALGNYLITIKKNNRIICFVDKYQVLKTYYFHIGDDWFITNSLADIGNVLDDIKIHEFSLIQETILVGAIGTQSIFENVFRLFGHQYIEVDAASGTFSIKEIPYIRERRNFQGRTIESAVSEYAEIIKSKFRIVAKCFGHNVHIHQTGGLDNRVVFSAFMSVGCKPKIMYGIGNSILTNTLNDDFLICKEYQKKFNLDFYEMNWQEDYIGNGKQYWNSLFRRHGFYYGIYGGSRNYFEEYEGKIDEYPDFMECGYFLENLRLREWAQNSGKNLFSINDFVDGYLLGAGYGNISDNKSSYPNGYKLKEYLVKIYKEYLQLYGIGENNSINLNNFDQVRWIHARNADSVSVNFLNEFAPSIAMFSLPELHEFPFDVPAKWRANAKFQLMLTHVLLPEALDIPIFSHCQKQKLNRETFSLTPENPPATPSRKKSLVRSVYRLLKKCGVPNNVRRTLKNVYKKLFVKEQRKDSVVQIINYDEIAEIKKMLLPIINEDSDMVGKFIVADEYRGHIVYLMRYAQYLHGVRLLREKSKEQCEIK